MKAKIKLIPFLLLAFIMLTANCCEKDDDPELPPITQTGEDTFGCLVNGEVWIPEGQILYYPEYSILHDQYTGVKFVDIIVRQTSVSGFRFSIPEDSVRVGGINLQKGVGRESGVDYEGDDEKKYYWGLESVGEFIITNVDTITNEVNVTPYRITAGTFWFDLISEEGEIVKIREGRFDFKDYSNEYIK